MAFFGISGSKIESSIKFLKGSIAHLEHPAIDHTNVLKDSGGAVSYISNVQPMTSWLFGQISISLSKFVFSRDIFIGYRYFGALTLVK